MVGAASRPASAPGDQVTTGYAESLGLRLRAGRLFDAGDERPDRYPVIVNEEFVRRYLQADRVIGRTFAGGPYGRRTPPTSSASSATC